MKHARYALDHEQPLFCLITPVKRYKTIFLPTKQQKQARLCVLAAPIARNISLLLTQFSHSIHSAHAVPYIVAYSIYLYEMINTFSLSYDPMFCELRNMEAELRERIMRQGDKQLFCKADYHSTPEYTS